MRSIKKKQKWYYYTTKLTREGDEKVWRVSDPEQHDEVFRSKAGPSIKKVQQEMYDEWNEGRPVQGGEFGPSYADLLRAAQKGGQTSSRRIWINEAEKQRAKRAKRDYLAGKEITTKQRGLLIKAGVIK
ncbi:MAG: hypothetical protein MRERV_3c119 [Mycoplasmataceae bacterium RV_VA103A]|nr:MAG: hypothetical protein MRERV_3c119 [Mycoplasmataceae bacterium RV_VA103A]